MVEYGVVSMSSMQDLMTESVARGKEDISDRSSGITEATGSGGSGIISKAVAEHSASACRRALSQGSMA